MQIRAMNESAGKQITTWDLQRDLMNDLSLQADLNDIERRRFVFSTGGISIIVWPSCFGKVTHQPQSRNFPSKSWCTWFWLTEAYLNEINRWGFMLSTLGMGTVVPPSDFGNFTRQHESRYDWWLAAHCHHSSGSTSTILLVRMFYSLPSQCAFLFWTACCGPRHTLLGAITHLNGSLCISIDCLQCCSCDSLTDRCARSKTSYQAPALPLYSVFQAIFSLTALHRLQCHNSICSTQGFRKMNFPATIQ